ncbi:hypothetical protein DS909_15265 [Phaeobacter gallaeciensis]|uniref:Uncharacterized protein n=2 Tax=Roseobacteraceae TaxID=2854170 RepID=A0A366WRX6_9RHOB|nr:hypothetical protein [Phaeobacter gallaeciensis]RBW52614.1 hypothetical protein DS909_15265 [Phaeobacter gallaeciensis]
MNHVKTIILLLATSACAPQITGSSSQAAVFESKPEPLINAFTQRCSQPPASFIRKSESHIQCRINMSPDETAAAILSYDGHIDDLPQIVIDLTTTPHENGVIVRIENYLNVPQRAGPDVHVVVANSRTERMLSRLFTGSGGKPL